MNWSTLVQAETLAGVLRHAGLVVVDCRFSLADTTQGARDYDEAHIPGARYAHLDRDLSRLSDDPRDGRHPWPDPDGFAQTIAGWGIGPEDQVVAYDADNGAIAARLWSLLRSHGHGRVAVLDGGWARWVALGLPVESRLDVLWEPPRRRSPSPACRLPQGHPAPHGHPVPQGHPALSRLLDADAVQAHLDAGGLLVDARAAPRFRGEVEPLDRVAGHVPGAVNRPFADNLQEDGRFKAPERLAQEFEALLGGREPSSLVAMCGSGVTACHHLLAMAHAGLPGGRLYAGSWSGWIGDPERPVARDA